MNQLFEAASNGHADEILELLREGAEKDSQDWVLELEIRCLVTCVFDVMKTLWVVSRQRSLNDRHVIL